MTHSILLYKFFRDTGGNVAITFAIVLPLLFMLVGGGIDYAYVILRGVGGVGYVTPLQTFILEINRHELCGLGIYPVQRWRDQG